MDLRCGLKPAGRREPAAAAYALVDRTDTPREVGGILGRDGGGSGSAFGFGDQDFFAAFHVGNATLENPDLLRMRLDQDSVRLASNRSRSIVLTALSQSSEVRATVSPRIAASASESVPREV